MTDSVPGSTVHGQPVWGLDRKEWMTLGAILLLAAVLRLGWPGVTEFKLDEARVYTLALGLVELRSLPLTATDMSVGLPNSPLAVYLYALPMLVWRHPLAPLLFGGALNTAAVGGVYLLGRRYWGARAAGLAALLFATAPWAVLYSRKIWASNLLPLFLVGYVFSGLLVFVERRQRWLLAHLALLSAIIQIHISSVVLAPVTLALLLLQRRHVNWRWVGYGVALAVLLDLPFLWYLARWAPAWRQGAPALGSRGVQLSLDALNLAAMLAGGTHTHSLAGPVAYRDFLATLPDFAPISWILWVLTLAGAACLALPAFAVLRRRQAAMDDRTRAGIILVTWLLMPLVAFLVHVSPVYPHYLTPYFTVAFILPGVAVDWVLGKARLNWQRTALMALPLAVAATQIWQVGALLQFVRTRSTPGAFGVPLERLLSVVHAAQDLDRDETIVVSDGTDAWSDGIPAVFDALLHDRPHRFVDGRTTAVFPGDSATAVIWPVDGGYAWPVRALYRAWGGGEWAAAVPLRAGEGEVLVGANAGSGLAVPRPREASALLANGAEVLGTGEDTQGWQMWWRPVGPEPGADYHLFAHLLDANGTRLARVDAPTYPGVDWRAGDLVASYFGLPPGGAAVRAGMYAYPSLAPVPVLNIDGEPAGDYLEFPR